ncbi:hypothetical protein EZV73_18805 [Acidaminobacter sp. JC074]|uniref:hypothetical protein n=1 Tax=Acidaminobacter sp. JC074 TaxID=2530199 RepID=UPI001F10AA68|nr:hypothetical protein [Acidaminobacter sp. JC074]MCH4889640.1 hypothetical protein [Acidaminobacter sp. JC074]
MTFKRGILIGVVLVFLVLLINEGLIGINDLDEPLFFEHHIDFSLDGRILNTKIYYVKNSGDRREVEKIDLDNKLTLHVDSAKTTKYGLLTLVELDLYSYMNDFEEESTIEVIDVTYNDGSNQIVDIGQINIVEVTNNEVFRFRYAEHSDKGTEFVIYDVSETVEVTAYDFNHPIEDDIELFISVDGRSYQVLDEAKVLDENLPVTVDKKFKVSARMPSDSYLIYDVQLKFKTSKGDMDLSNYTYRPALDRDSVRTFVESRKK